MKLENLMQEITVSIRFDDRYELSDCVQALNVACKQLEEEMDETQFETLLDLSGILYNAIQGGYS